MRLALAQLRQLQIVFQRSLRRDVQRLQSSVVIADSLFRADLAIGQRSQHGRVRLDHRLRLPIRVIRCRRKLICRHWTTP